MKIGFTGTREGMTPAQKQQLHSILQSYRGGEFHHGDCVGADIEAEEIALACGLTVVVHPPLNRQYRAFSKQPALTPKDYMVRNRDIVHASDVLLAAPKEAKELQRGGTWSTWRYAQQMRKPTTLVYPDGARLLRGYDVVGAKELGLE